MQIFIIDGEKCANQWPKMNMRKWSKTEKKNWLPDRRSKWEMSEVVKSAQRVCPGRARSGSGSGIIGDTEWSAGRPASGEVGSSWMDLCENRTGYLASASVNMGKRKVLLLLVWYCRLGPGILISLQNATLIFFFFLLSECYTSIFEWTIWRSNRLVHALLAHSKR